jgi:hypothetical protein
MQPAADAVITAGAVVEQVEWGRCAAPDKSPVLSMFFMPFSARMGLTFYQSYG